MKASIRKEIEKILGLSGSNQVFIDPTNKNKTQYRMKIVGRKLLSISEELRRKIEKLPHVNKTGFCISPEGRPYNYGYFDGFCIYFDCKPSLIKV